VTLDAGGRRTCLPVVAGTDAASHGGGDTRVAACAVLFSDFARAIRGEVSDDLPHFDDAVAARRATHAIEAAAGYVK
jgi:hypothetical protein